ncbi:hypothetical protein E2C01_059427 [Portunus trituberculatus]|uniref:Uncharacterized protein n=1 Tax=Portunus trituberculatus TaxID=210409 RepID=A0A5B7H911_PORTR|nr:hypothetical protein [Portunus trituberculatus]
MTRNSAFKSHGKESQPAGRGGGGHWARMKRKRRPRILLDAYKWSGWRRGASICCECIMSAGKDKQNMAFYFPSLRASSRRPLPSASHPVIVPSGAVGTHSHLASSSVNYSDPGFSVCGR